MTPSSRMAKYLKCGSVTRGFRTFILLAALCFLSACTTDLNNPGRFQEDDATDVALHFYDWNCIQMTRPNTRQDGYLPIFSRAEIQQELRNREVARNLAVVVFSNTYRGADVTQLAREWKRILRDLGFRRVVLLRAGPSDRIRGLLIIEDSAIYSKHDETGHTRALAALSPAAGADAANPSGDSIR